MSIFRPCILLCLALALCAASTNAQTTGTCTWSEAYAYLDANNVRAGISNSGSLFYRGGPHIYSVPWQTEINAIFAASLWVGAKVGNEVRTAATTYWPWEFWAGPLDENGNPPADCSEYDRVYKVTRQDIDDYETSSVPALDLADWPTGLGAPTTNVNGQIIDLLDQPLSLRKQRKIDLEAGERPVLLGDQSIWWIMNDRGNEHERTKTEPLGIEVHVNAYALSSSEPALENSTLYGLRIFNRSFDRLDSVYVGLWLDADLGNLDDDFVGSDSVRGIGFVYNADNDDEGERGYGVAPPAIGVRLLEGPRVDGDGKDNNHDGRIDEPDERLGLSFVGTHFKGSDINRSPRDASDYFHYLSGRWRDGSHWTKGSDRGNGDPTSDVPIRFVYPGDPETSGSWTEFNIDDSQTPPGDRRMTISVGPFTLKPGAENDISFAIVWARGKNHLASVTAMKEASDVVLEHFDEGFRNAPAAVNPDRLLLLSPADGMTEQPTNLTLRWQPHPSSNFYEVKVESSAGIESYSSGTNYLLVDDLPVNETIHWIARGSNTAGYGPWSEVYSFSTNDVNFEEHVGFTDFLTVQNRLGPLDPPIGASADWRGFPGLGRPTSGQQSGNGRWIIATGMSSNCSSNCGDYSSFISRTVEERINGWTYVASNDFEIRFTTAGSLHYDRFDSVVTGGAIIDGDDLPFELWNIGSGTPDDPSDDFRMIAAGLDISGDGWGITPIDHESSQSPDNPTTDWFYWFNPADTSPGTAGYDAWAARSLITGTGSNEFLGPEVMGNMVLFSWLSGGLPLPYNHDLPEEGTVFRIETGAAPVAPLLSFPGYGFEVNAGAVTFYWSGASIDEFRIHISDQSDFSGAIDVPNVEPGFEASLERNGQYYWRVQRGNQEWSNAWTFEIVGGISGVSTAERGEIPDKFELFPNYPNPFNSSTVISYTLPVARHVRLEVFDLLGRTVLVLTDQMEPPGHHELSIQDSSLPSGTYFYRVRAGAFVETKMMTVVR